MVCMACAFRASSRVQAQGGPMGIGALRSDESGSCPDPKAHSYNQMR